MSLLKIAEEALEKMDAALDLVDDYVGPEGGPAEWNYRKRHGELVRQLQEYKQKEVKGGFDDDYRHYEDSIGVIVGVELSVWADARLQGELTEAEMKESAIEAVRNTLDNAQLNGFSHRLEAELSLEVMDVSEIKEVEHHDRTD